MKEIELREQNISTITRLGLEPADQDSLRILPAIRRYRDYHAYAFNGIRYLDLWRNDGQSLLGYSIPTFQLGIKNRVSQALWGSAPHPAHKQVQKSLERYFPLHHAIICPDRESVRAVLESMQLSVQRPLIPLAGDFFPKKDDTNVSVWLPFSGTVPLAGATLAIIPVPSSSGPFVLLLARQGLDIPKIKVAFDFISHYVPAYAITAMHVSLRALEALGAFTGGGSAPARVRDVSQKLGLWKQESWATINTGNWQRVGPYLSHSFSSEAYHRVCAHALGKGIILNPRTQGVSCLPGFMSNGEKKLLESVLAFTPEGDA